MRLFPILILASLVAGCATVPNTFIASERQEYNALTPYLNAYAQEHPSSAQAINDNLQSWNDKLTKAEQAVGQQAAPTTQPSTQP